MYADVGPQLESEMLEALWLFESCLCGRACGRPAGRPKELLVNDLQPWPPVFVFVFVMFHFNKNGSKLNSPRSQSKGSTLEAPMPCLLRAALRCAELNSVQIWNDGIHHANGVSITRRQEKNKKDDITLTKRPQCIT